VLETKLQRVTTIIIISLETRRVSRQRSWTYQYSFVLLRFRCQPYWCSLSVPH